MACVRSFEAVFVVESWNIAVNLDGILLFETPFSYSSLYFLTTFIERNRKICFASLLLGHTVYLKQGIF